jgi:hypothetical protein
LVSTVFDERERKGRIGSEVRKEEGKRERGRSSSKRKNYFSLIIIYLCTTYKMFYYLI